MKRTFKIVMIILIVIVMLLISGISCDEKDRQRKEFFDSVEAYLSKVDDTLLKSKELGNYVIVITESETGSLTEHVLLMGERKESYKLLDTETIQREQTAITIVERSIQFPDEDSVNYIVFSVNDDYLNEKGGAIYLTNKGSEDSESATSVLIKPFIMPMDKSQVYILENRYTMKLSQEEAGKGFESTSKTISYSDSFLMMSIESISITDQGGTVLYYYLLDE